jgi:glycosyltransferase involved in cell wall biosynthesis
VESSIYYIANVFDESAKHKRAVLHDSPAANRKVFSLCRAVRLTGGHVEIISLGRIRVRRAWKFYPCFSTEADAVPITYLHFLNIPVVTHIVTMFSLLIFIMGRTDKDSIYIFYNYYLHYLLTLLFCRLTGRRCILDIEDGCRADEKNIRSLPHSLLLRIANFCCLDGVMLATSALREQSSGQRSYVCYGIADQFPDTRNWSITPLQVHLGGLLEEDTGVLLFLETLRLLKFSRPQLCHELRFVVTGYGPLAKEVKIIAEGSMKDILHYAGKVSLSEYKDIIRHSHVGLSLKARASSMGATTFPSKVIELASNGMLLVTTKVSDVPLLFDNSTAMLLESETPEALADILVYIVNNPQKARDIAQAGRKMIQSRCSEEKIGRDLLQFWLGSDTMEHL